MQVVALVGGGNGGVHVGPVVGVLIVLAVIVVGIFIIVNRRRR